MFQDLIDRKLVKGNTHGDLTIFKYARKVFYDALWNEDSRLLDARGMVLDSAGNKVIWPFTKVFNYGENGKTVDRDKEVVWVRKVNGFMASARWYKDKLLVSSTGSLNSDFVKLAESVLGTTESIFWRATQSFTLIFEICHHSDPHIVEEMQGAYLIGARDMNTGEMMSEYFLDWLAPRGGFLRPEHGVSRFSDVVGASKVVEHEGFMVRDRETGKTLVKIKSTHYLTKKFLMRMTANKVDFMYNDKEEFMKTIDEEFYPVVEFITTEISKEYWKALTDQERREILEGFFNE